MTLRAGNTAVREVFVHGGKWVFVVCKVAAKPDDEATPCGSCQRYFLCTADVDGTQVSTGSYTCATAARQILQDLKAVSKHHWRGDFFGFNISSVQALLSIPDAGDYASQTKERDEGK